MTEPPLFEVVATRSGARAMLDRATGEVMHPLSGPIEEPRSLYVRPSRLEDAPSHAGEPSRSCSSTSGLARAPTRRRRGRSRRRGPRPGAAGSLHIVSFDRTFAALELALASGARRDVRARRHDARGRAAACSSTARPRGARHRLARVARASCRRRCSPSRPASADVVYWDPFSPRANPSLWNVAAFTALRRLCRDGATVHTYSGATATRTALLLAGFAVGFGDVLPSGRQATRGRDSPRRPRERRSIAAGSTASRGRPRRCSSDAPADAFDRIAGMSQFQ